MSARLQCVWRPDLEKTCLRALGSSDTTSTWKPRYVCLVSENNTASRNDKKIWQALCLYSLPYRDVCRLGALWGLTAYGDKSQTLTKIHCFSVLTLSLLHECSFKPERNPISIPTSDKVTTVCLLRCPLQELYANAAEEVTGFIHHAHQWVNMTDVTVQINETHTVSTHTHTQIKKFRLEILFIIIKIWCHVSQEQIFNRFFIHSFYRHVFSCSAMCGTNSSS